MGRNAKKWTLTLFLIALFTFLAVFTGTWINKLYLEQTDYSDATSASIFECNEYYPVIQKVIYENEALIINLESKSGGIKFDSYTILWNGTSYEIDTTNLYVGMAQEYIIPVKGENSFLRGYPETCEGNLRKYDLRG